MDEVSHLLSDKVAKDLLLELTLLMIFEPHHVFLIEFSIDILNLFSTVHDLLICYVEKVL
jgi:hypothetical protein